MKGIGGLLAVVAATLLVIGGLVLVVYLIQGYIAPPCDGGYTGSQTFKGHEIQCFYGDVVEVRS